MAISIKTEEQIQIMKEAGSILADLTRIFEDKIRPGITTKELDKIAEKYILKKGAVPSFKGYHGFPAAICASINEEVIHGIPSKRRLVEGDIISIDMGSYYKGFHGDCARTYPVGEILPETQKLIDVTKQSFFEGIKFAREGCFLNDIGTAIQTYVEENGFSVVRDFVGHGIGKELHEDPAVANFKEKARGVKLKAGMVLAIEPMVNAGTYEIKVLDDDWTVVTLDNKLAAHYENTVLITKGDPVLFTL